MEIRMLKHWNNDMQASPLFIKLQWINNREMGKWIKMHLAESCTAHRLNYAFEKIYWFKKEA